jgi:hypothetical protein
MSWFDVDKEGLAKLFAHKGKSFVVHELVQNAWDEVGVMGVTVSLKWISRKWCSASRCW